MKIHIPRPPKDVIRITFRKKDQPFEYILLDDTTVTEVLDFLAESLPKIVKHDMFYKGLKIGIDVRAYRGSKAGVSKSISFGSNISTIELRNLVFNYINNLK